MDLLPSEILDGVLDFVALDHSKIAQRLNLRTIYPALYHRLLLAILRNLPPLEQDKDVATASQESMQAYTQALPVAMLADLLALALQCGRSRDTTTGRTMTEFCQRIREYAKSSEDAAAAIDQLWMALARALKHPQEKSHRAFLLLRGQDLAGSDLKPDADFLAALSVLNWSPCLGQILDRLPNPNTVMSSRIFGHAMVAAAANDCVGTFELLTARSQLQLRQYSLYQACILAAARFDSVQVMQRLFTSKFQLFLSLDEQVRQLSVTTRSAAWESGGHVTEAHLRDKLVQQPLLKPFLLAIHHHNVSVALLLLEHMTPQDQRQIMSIESCEFCQDEHVPELVALRQRIGQTDLPNYGGMGFAELNVACPAG